MKKIKCPFCGEEQPLDESHHYIKKILSIFICILLAGILYYALIFSILLFGLAIMMIVNIRKKQQHCVKCQKLIENPEKYITKSDTQTIRYLSCDIGNTLNLLAMGELLKAVSENNIKDFLVAYKKISFNNLPNHKKESFITSKLEKRPTIIRFKSFSSYTFETHYYSIIIDEGNNIAFD